MDERDDAQPVEAAPLPSVKDPSPTPEVLSTPDNTNHSNPVLVPIGEDPIKPEWSREGLGRSEISHGEQMFVASMLSGMGATAAGIALAAPRPGSVVANSPRVKSAIRCALETEGLDEGYLAKKLREGCEATKFASLDDDSSLEVPDHSVRHKFISTVLEVRGDMQKAKEVGEESFEEVLFQIKARRSITE